MKVQVILAIAVTLLVGVSAIPPMCPPTNEPGVVIHFPHSTDCDKYLTCSWGALVEQLCPTGLLWNDVVKYCDHPQNVYCNGATWTTGNPGPVSTTAAPIPTSTPDSGLSDKCPENYDPNHQMFLPHLDCDKYYICSWYGEALLGQCPAGLHWNQLLSYCDYPIAVGCSTKPTSEVPSSPAVTPSSTPGMNFDDCPEKYDPNFQVYFPHPDCTKYYICTYEGNKLEQNCPPTLHWSQTSRYCDRPELAQCVSGSYPPSTSTHPATEAPATSSTLECPLLQSGDDLPVFLPNKDCTKYYVCVHGQPIELSCPAGLFWNATKDVCDFPSESGCRH